MKKQLRSEETSTEAVQFDLDWVNAATADTFTWVTQHTQTHNEHWVEEGRPSPTSLSRPTTTSVTYSMRLICGKLFGSRNPAI